MYLRNIDLDFLDSAFVTLRRPEQAQCIMLFHEYRRKRHWWSRSKGPSFDMAYAPPAKSVLWENITPHYWLWLKEMAVNFGLFGLVVLLAAPDWVFQQIINRVSQYLPFFRNPTVIGLYNLLVRSVIQLAVLMSSSLLGYWTEGNINDSLLVKSYIVLLVKLFIIPMISANSIMTLFLESVQSNNR